MRCMASKRRGLEIDEERRWIKGEAKRILWLSFRLQLHSLTSSAAESLQRDFDAAIILYCRNGAISIIAAKMLQRTIIINALMLKS